jgi:hypothetical protein
MAKKKQPARKGAMIRNAAVNRDKTGLWKADIAQSVDLYNDWFMKFAPKAFRDTSVATATSGGFAGYAWATTPDT